MQTPYRVLGIDRTADAATIKAAFRAIAKRDHPDLNPGNTAAEQRFKEANAAYDVLSDPKKRAELDSQLSSSTVYPPHTASTSPRWGTRQQDFSWERPKPPPHADWGDIFDQPQQRGSGDPITVQVSMETSRLGGMVEVVLPSGARGQVRIPANTPSGTLLRWTGEGQTLLLLVEVLEKASFHQRGLDLHHDVFLPVYTAILGGKIEVPLPEGGAVGVSIPPGTQHGQRLRVRGRGAYGLNGLRGDLYIHTLILIPTTLTTAQKRAMKSFERASQPPVSKD